MAYARLAGAAACLAAAAACFGCARANGGGAVAPAREPEAPTVFGGHPGMLRSARFELALQLPDRKAWQVDDRRTPWLVATHETTRSTLVARSWVEEGPTTRHRCYEQARRWRRELPDIDTSPAVSDELRKAGDIELRVVSGVDVPEGSPDIVGTSVAVGAQARKCLVVAYQTKAGRHVGPEVVADRLAVVAEMVMARAMVDRPLDVVREPRGER